MSDEKSIAGWIVDHINVCALTAIGGFSIFGAIEGRMCTAWGASRAGCLAFAGFAFALGTNVGSWLVKHFETDPISKALEDAGRQIESLTNRIASDERAREKHENQVAGLRAAVDNEKRKNAELARRWDLEEERRKIDEQRNADADRLLKLTLAECTIIDGILATEANGELYHSAYNEALGHLYSSGVIKDFGAGDVYMIKMSLRPFFERYATAIHEMASGTNDDRLRIAECVRQGTYQVAGKPLT